jgi:peptide/nickel transport system permease protein
VLGFGAAIPIEALCDVPGVGQLAWKAALARDLPLLCGLALVITFTVAVVQSLGDMTSERT